MSQAAPRPVVVEEMTAADIDEVASFILRESSAREPSAEESERSALQLRHVLVENPVDAPGVPHGWVLRPEPGGPIVGAMCCIPWCFTRGGVDHVSLMSAKYFVAEAYRGSGLAIFMRYIKLGRRFPLHCTTAGARSAPLWKQFGAKPIPRQDFEMIAFADRSRLVEEAAFRASKSRLLASTARAFARLLPRGLGSLRGDGQLVPVRDLDQLVALGADAGSDRITTRRDAAYLSWRYFSGDRFELFELRRPWRPSLVLAVEHLRRGFRSQIRTLAVQDMFGRPTVGDDAVAAAAVLARHFAGRFDMLVFRALDEPQQAALAAVGFRRRAFEAPIAWCIDKAGLLPDGDWHLVPADAE